MDAEFGRPHRGAIAALGLLWVVGALVIAALALHFRDVLAVWQQRSSASSGLAATQATPTLSILLPDTQATSPANPAQPTTTPGATTGLPTRLIIPTIQLKAPIVPVGMQTFEQQGQVYGQWLVPKRPAVGWQNTSAIPGQLGNMVLNGHHNEYGQVFRYLVDVNVGDIIQVYAGDVLHSYVVTEKHILPEKDQSLSVRLANALWIEPSGDERLTLVTCWPYTSNTHRLIVVARPVAASPQP